MEHFCLDQKMNVFTFDKNRKSLIIKATVSSLTITGSENVIILEAKIPNLIIAGNLNQITARHDHSELSNVIFNGNNNSIIASNTNFNKINNGRSNSINNTQLRGFNFGSNFTVFNNFENSSFNINFNNRTPNTFANFTNIADLISAVAGGGNQSNMPMQQNEQYDNEEEYDNNYYYSGEGEEEEEEKEEPEEEEVDIFSNDNNNPLDKRMNIILDLNEFQYKHANKYVAKAEEKCALCKVKFSKTDIIRQFACGDHIFHKKCLAKWLKKSDLCPLCKYDLNKGTIDNIKLKQVNNNK